MPDILLAERTLEEFRAVERTGGPIWGAVDLVPSILAVSVRRGAVLLGA